MIKLSVQPYCHNCMKFSPEVLRDSLYGNGIPVFVEQKIVCEHRFECEAISEYLLNELTNSTENKGE